MPASEVKSLLFDDLYHSAQRESTKGTRAQVLTYAVYCLQSVPRGGDYRTTCAIRGSRPNSRTFLRPSSRRSGTTTSSSDRRTALLRAPKRSSTCAPKRRTADHSGQPALKSWSMSARSARGAPTASLPMFPSVRTPNYELLVCAYLLSSQTTYTTREEGDCTRTRLSPCSASGWAISSLAPRPLLCCRQNTPSCIASRFFSPPSSASSTLQRFTASSLSSLQFLFCQSSGYSY